MLVLLLIVVISAAVAAEDVAEDRSSSEVHYGYQRHYGYHPHLSGGIFKFDLFEPITEHHRITSPPYSGKYSYSKSFRSQKFLIWGAKRCVNIVKNLDRKALLSLSATAILAFKWTITHHTPSVFCPDRRGNRRFLIQTLGPEFWGHPHPHGEPQQQQGQKLILEHISQKRHC